MLVAIFQTEEHGPSLYNIGHKKLRHKAYNDATITKSTLQPNNTINIRTLLVKTLKILLHWKQRLAFESGNH